MSTWLWKKVSYTATLIAVFLLFVFAVIASGLEIKDLDLWLHLATGRHITQFLQVPAVDILSCTISGQPWVNHEWLFQILVHNIFTGFGAEGLITVRVILVIFSVGALLMLGYNRERQGFDIFVLWLVVLVFQLRFTLRPDLFSVAFFILYIYTLSFQLKNKRSVWILFLIQLLWVNVHGFFILGPILVLMGIASETIKRNIKLPFEWNAVARLTDEEFKRLYLILAVSLSACLINPHFIEGALYPFKILFSISGESKIFFDHIGELAKPITLQNIFSIRVYPFYKSLIVLSCLGFVLNYRKIDISALILWAAFLFFSLNAVRNVVFFAVAAFFAVLTNIDQIQIKSLLPSPFKTEKGQIVIATVLKGLLIMWMLNAISGLSLQGYFDFDAYQRKSEFGGISQRNFPYKAVNFLIENRIEGNFFNDFNSGAYLLGRAHPSIKVFIDGRTEAYGPKFFKEYREIWKGDQKLFEQYADKFNLTGAFLNSSDQPVPAKFIRYLYENPEWKLIYFNYDAAIFLKDVAQNKLWIDQHAVDLTQYKTKPIDLLKVGGRKIKPYQYTSRAHALLNLKFYDQSRHEAKEALRIAPHYDKPYIILGKINLVEKEYVKAFENFRTAKVINPNDLEVRFLLGASFYYLDRLDQAEKQVDYVLKGNVKNAKALYLLALIYAKKQRVEQSLIFFQEAYALEPKEIKPMLELGELFLSQRKYGHAKQVLRLAGQIDAKNKKLIELLKKLPQKVQ